MRSYRGVVAVERVAAGGEPERYLTYAEDDDGSLLLRARLPGEEGALVLAALHAAQERLTRGDADSVTDPRASGDRPAALAAPDQGASQEAGTTANRRPDLEDDASAEAPTATQRRADALVLMADRLLAHGPAQHTADRFQVVVHVDAETLRDDTRGGRCETADGAPLAIETARRLACDAAVVPLLKANGQPLSIGRKTRVIPPALRRALANRDHGCRFPGCAERRFVDAHHLHHWAHGGQTSLTNLVQLCRHHHRLLHEGGYTIQGRPDGQLTFRRPDGHRLPTSPTPPRGHTHTLTGQRHPKSDACVPAWTGERLDLRAAVDAMLTFAPLPQTELAPEVSTEPVAA